MGLWHVSTLRSDGDSWCKMKSQSNCPLPPTALRHVGWPRVRTRALAEPPGLGSPLRSATLRPLLPWHPAIPAKRWISGKHWENPTFSVDDNEPFTIIRTVQVLHHRMWQEWGAQCWPRRKHATSSESNAGEWVDVWFHMRL